MLIAEYGDRVERNMTDAQLEVWGAVLSDVTDQALEAAVVCWLRTGHPHPPRSGELRRLALEATGAERSDHGVEVDAGKAWEAAHRFISGDYRPRHLTRYTQADIEEAFAKEHPRAMAVLRRLGRPSDLGQVEAGAAARNLRPNFIRTYVAMANDAKASRMSRTAINGQQPKLLR